MGARRMIGRLISMSAASLRQLERDMEVVIDILQPGPLGIVEHKYSDHEIAEARASRQKAIENWQQASLERKMAQKMNSELNNI